MVGFYFESELIFVLNTYTQIKQYNDENIRDDSYSQTHAQFK